MSVSLLQLAQARELLTELLDELGLAAYRFEVEPHETAWRILVECEVDGGWRSVSLDAPLESLAGSQNGHALRRTLLARLADSLSECRRLKPS